MYPQSWQNFASSLLSRRVAIWGPQLAASRPYGATDI